MTRYLLALHAAGEFPDLPFDERDTDTLLAAFPR
jgi:hypothetical protein